MMISYRACVYNKEGKSQVVETLEARDALYSSGEWFDSPQAAKEALDKDIAATQRKLDENQEAQNNLADGAHHKGKKAK